MAAKEKSPSKEINATPTVMEDPDSLPPLPTPNISKAPRVSLVGTYPADKLQQGLNHVSDVFQDSSLRLDQITNQLDNSANITNNLLSRIESQTEKLNESEKKRDQNEERRNTSTDNLIQTIQAQTKVMQ